MGRQDCKSTQTKLIVVVEITERPKKKDRESFVDLPPSLQDLGEGKAKKPKVDLKDIRAQHERDRLGDR